MPTSQSSVSLPAGAQLISKLGVIAAGGISYTHLCDQAAAEIATLLEADAACVLQAEEDGKSMRIISCTSAILHRANHKYSPVVEGPWISRILASANPVVSLSFSDHPSDPPAPHLTDRPPGEILAALIGTPGHVRGILLAIRSRRKSQPAVPFTSQEMSYFAVAADLLHAASSRQQDDPTGAWQHRMLPTIFDSLPSLVVILDNHGYYRYCNRATEEWLGWPKEKILHRTYREMLGDECVDLIESFLRRALAGEKLRFEAKEPHRDGSLRDVVIDYIPYYSEEGAVEGIYVVVTDFTEIKKAEQRLREANKLLEQKVRARTEELQEISANVPAYFYYVDSEEHYLFANKLYASFYGLNPEQLLGKKMREVIGEEQYKIASPHLQHALAGKEIVYSNTVKKQGKPAMFFRARYSPRRDPNGKTIGAYFLATDVTAERELERATLKAADAERETVARELHDGICQELTAISFLAKSVERRLRLIGNQETDSFAEVGNQIRETLEKTRNIAHGLSIAPQGMLGLRNSMCMFLKSMSHDPQLRSILRFNLDEKFVTSEISGQLYLIFREAITNSLKHGRPSLLVISVCREKTLVRLTVADNGCANPQIPENSPGMGLRTMSYRARLLGGTTRITPRRGRPGVVVHCEIPLR